MPQGTAFQSRLRICDIGVALRILGRKGRLGCCVEAAFIAIRKGRIERSVYFDACTMLAGRLLGGLQLFRRPLTPWQNISTWLWVTRKTEPNVDRLIFDSART